MIDYWQVTSERICSTWLLFLALDLVSAIQGNISETDVLAHLERGRDFLAKGQLQDALTQYHMAVEGDPENYLTYFKRGTVYLAIGKAKFALQDFDKVLELKPDFHSARYQRGLLLVKQGDINKAKVDLYTVYNSDSNLSEDAYNHYANLDNVKNEIDTSFYYFEHKDYDSAIEVLTRIIEVCPWSSALRELRSECHLIKGNTDEAIFDLKYTTKLSSDNTDGYYKVSTLQYRFGRLDESLKEIRECLKLDPDHKTCFPHYKKVKKIDKLLTDSQKAAEEKDYKTCIDKAQKVLSTENNEQMIIFHAKEKLCHCYLHDDQFSSSLEICQEALNVRRTEELHCDKADAYIASEMYDEAIHEFNKALELNRQYQRAANGLKRAQRLQKQAGQRDYYKILEVKRSATKREIVKAYRRAAQKWHPDNFQGDEKKIAEKRFIDIAAAKEVLTDEDKRKLFDSGQDPLDPNVNQHSQSGFNNFQHFHGSPFTFKFNFN